MTPKATWLSHYTFTVELSEFESRRRYKKKINCEII